ncbi:MAG: DUF885 domain-containing protein [Dorea sp.]|nr:DUF885 domain-containing protein [Dorea sp.]
MSKKRSVIALLLFLSVLFTDSFLVQCAKQDENSEFESYTSSLFLREVSANTISLHYTLKDPGAFGISDIPVSLGYMGTDRAAVCASLENELSLLHSFRQNQLSRENQLTFEILEHSLNSSLKEAEYLLYEEPLAPLTGTQAQLPVILSEYRFYQLSDCEDYLELLTQVPEYFRSILEFEQAKSKAGLFMSDSNADALVKECKTFIQMGSSNYLFSSFEERLKELTLSEAEKKRCIDTNRLHIETCVFPAYQNLIDGLARLRGTGKNNGGLCHLPDGKKYYELTVASQTGSSRTIPELRTLTLSQMADDTAAIQKVLAESYKDSGKTDASSTEPRQNILSGTSPEEILNQLKTGLDGLFPASPDVDTRIKYVQESMEEYLSPAFYMIPAIDDMENNVIYINKGHMPDSLSLFTTLAHEGYPGHLYQTTYYSATSPDPVRNVLSFGGYTEGWATYSEMLSYYFTPLTREQALLTQRNASVILGLYALADIGIHYDGWSLLDTVAFFRDYGIRDTSTVEEIYSLIVTDPGNYLKYYIGYVEFLELKKDAIKKWGDKFSQERFHKAVLDVGPAPFELLRKYIIR